MAVVCLTSVLRAGWLHGCSVFRMQQRQAWPCEVTLEPSKSTVTRPSRALCSGWREWAEVSLSLVLVSQAGDRSDGGEGGRTSSSIILYVTKTNGCLRRRQRLCFLTNFCSTVTFEFNYSVNIYI